MLTVTLNLTLTVTHPPIVAEDIGSVREAREHRNSSDSSGEHRRGVTAPTFAPTIEDSSARSVGAEIMNF